MRTTAWGRECRWRRKSTSTLPGIEREFTIVAAFGGGQSQSVVDRGDCVDGDVYGGAGYEHRECFAAAHRGWDGGKFGGEHVGADKLPGEQCDCFAHQRVAGDNYGAQTFLHDMRGAVWNQLVVVRIGPKPRLVDFL